MSAQALGLPLVASNASSAAAKVVVLSTSCTSIHKNGKQRSFAESSCRGQCISGAVNSRADIYIQIYFVDISDLAEDHIIFHVRFMQKSRKLLTYF